MTEAMWVEIIRVLPTLVWLGFAIAALVVARRVLAGQAYRMTRVETPFVSVELAQEAIEAAHRRAADAVEPPSMPSQQSMPATPSGARPSVPGARPNRPGTRPSGIPQHVEDRERGHRAAARLAASADLLQGGSILWVDDHPEWNEPLVRLFRTAGLRVDTATSTEDATRLLNRRAYDLVITDMRRPEEPAGDTAGMALVDHIVGEGYPMPAIFFSSEAVAENRTHPRAATATDSPEALVDSVVDLIGRRRRRFLKL